MARSKILIASLLTVMLLTVFSPTATSAVDLDLRKVGTWPGYPRPNWVNDVAVVDGHLYLATDEGLRVVDVSNPSDPRLVHHSVDGQWISGVAASDSWVYLAGNELGMQVLDVSDPGHPNVVGEYKHDAPISSIAADDNHVGIIAESRIYVIDVSDRAAPRLRGSYWTRASARIIAVTGDHAWVVNDRNFLDVIDLSNSDQPALVARYDAGHQIHDVVVTGSLAWMANGTSGLEILDISDPTHPRWVGAYQVRGHSIEDVAVQDGYAILIDRFLERIAINGVSLEVIDVRNPANPRRVAGTELHDQPSTLAMFGKHVYLPRTRAKVDVYSVENPAAPDRIGTHAEGGEVRDISVSRNLACLADGPGGLRVLDIRDSTHPRNVGNYLQERFVDGVVLADGIAYVSVGEEANELHLVDLSDPAAPTLRGTYPTTSTIHAIVVADGIAYLALDSGGLQIVDATDPSAPRRIGVFGTPSPVTALAVAGPWAYLVLNEMALRIVDVQDLTAPMGAGVYRDVSRIHGVTAAGAYAYLACGKTGLQVIDVSDPTEPHLVGALKGHRKGTLEGVSYYGPIGLADDHVFAASGVLVPNRFEAVDVSDPEHPIRVGRIGTRGVIPTFSLSGKHAWLGAGDWNLVGGHVPGEGVVSVKLTRRANPQRIGGQELTEVAWDLAVVGDTAYVAARDAGLTILDTSDPTNPIALGEYQSSGPVRCVALSPPYAYLGTHRLEIVDVSNPAAPQWVARSPFVLDDINDIVLTGDHAFLATGWDGLYITDIADPANPMNRSVWKAGDLTWVQSLAVVEEYAYLAMREAGLRVVDVSDPAAPIGRGAVDAAEAFGVAVSGRFACVADGASGLTVIDVNDPDNPSPVSEIDVGGFAYDVTLFGDLAFIAVGGPGSWAFAGGGIQVVDLSDPVHPRRVGGNNLLDASAIAVDGDHIYVAAGVQGLAILDAFQPPPIIESIAEPGGVRLLLRAAQGQPVRLQRSTDLVRWEEWLGITGTGDAQTLVDPGAETEPVRFYRAYAP